LLQIFTTFVLIFTVDEYKENSSRASKVKANNRPSAYLLLNIFFSIFIYPGLLQESSPEVSVTITAGQRQPNF